MQSNHRLRMSSLILSRTLYSPKSLAEITQAQLDELQTLVKSGHRFKVFQWGELVVSPLEEESPKSHSDFYFVRERDWLIPQRLKYTFVAVGMVLVAGIKGDGNTLFGAIAGVIRNLSGGKNVTDYVLVAIRRNLHVVSRDASLSEFFKNLNL